MTTESVNLSMASRAALAKTELINKLRNEADFGEYKKSTVELFPSSSTVSRKNRAYLDYSQKLLDSYYDINGDGSVTVKEFAEQEKAKRLSILGMSEDENVNYKEVLSKLNKNEKAKKAYDYNGDGKVDLPEFFKAKEELEFKETLLSKLNKNEKAKKAYDYNGDGKIDIAEITKVMKEKKIEIEPSKLELGAERSTNLFANNLDMNSDGIISKEEFAYFNKEIDSLDGEKGELTFSAEKAMFNAVIGANAKNEEINYVVNKYIKGEDLTEEEKEILEDSMVRIKEAIKEDSSF